jgi:signal transduction histidine kinase/Tfp pilus assembly protein PilF
MKRFHALLFLFVIGLVRFSNSQDPNEHDSLLTVYSSLLNSGISNGDSLQVANACLNLGITYIKVEDYSKALEYLERARNIDLKLGQDSSLVIVYNKLALMHRFKGEYAEAIDDYESGISLAESISDTAAANQTRLYLGIIYKLQGNYDKALEIFLVTLPYYEESDNLSILTPLDNCIGTIFYSQKEYDEALKHLNSALDASKKLGLKPDEAINLAYLGLVHRELGNFNEALQFHFKALEVYSECGSNNDIGWICNEIGNTYAISGNPTLSEDYYNRALQSARASGDNEIKSASLLGLGSIMIGRAEKNKSLNAKDLYAKARRYLEEALDLSLVIGQKEYLMQIHRLLFEADSATGNLPSALNQYKHFTRYKDSLNDLDIKHKIAKLDYKFLHQQKEKEIAILAKENEIKSIQIKKQKMLRNGSLFTAALIIITAMLIFRSIRLRRKLDKQQVILAERERLSGDLHDDVGSGLSKIILLLEVLDKDACPAGIKERIGKISSESLDLSKNISGVIWALNSRYDSLESLVAFIRKYSGDYFENTAVQFKMNALSNFPSVHLSSEQRRNIYYAFKEALHNIVKHANATVAEVQVTYEEHRLTLLIQDNGIGLPSGELNRFGNGILQMQKRMESIGGSFFIENRAGTRIMLTIPVLKNRP